MVIFRESKKLSQHQQAVLFALTRNAVVENRLIRQAKRARRVEARKLHFWKQRVRLGKA